MVFTFNCYRDPKTFWSYDIIHIRFPKYSYVHRISSVILLSIRKNLCSLRFIVIMTDIQNFCDRNSVTHNKNQNAIGSIHVKNPIYKTWFTAHVSGMTTTDEIPWPWLYSLIHIILMFFIWSGNHKFYIQFLRLLRLQWFIITLYYFYIFSFFLLSLSCFYPVIGLFSYVRCLNY
jgi:hypothetical protein